MENRRIFTEDGYDLVIAIKQREEPRLVDRFQAVWMQRCMNPCNLPMGDVYRILSDFACENFTKADWHQYGELTKNHFTVKSNMKREELITILLTVIVLMRMVD